MRHRPGSASTATGPARIPGAPVRRRRDADGGVYGDDGGGVMGGDAEAGDGDASALIVTGERPVRSLAAEAAPLSAKGERRLMASMSGAASVAVPDCERRTQSASDAAPLVATSGWRGWGGET